MRCELIFYFKFASQYLFQAATVEKSVISGAQLKDAKYFAQAYWHKRDTSILTRNTAEPQVLWLLCNLKSKTRLFPSFPPLQSLGTKS